MKKTYQKPDTMVVCVQTHICSAIVWNQWRAMPSTTVAAKAAVKPV